MRAMSDLPEPIRVHLDRILLKRDDKCMYLVAKRPHKSVDDVLSLAELQQVKQLPLICSPEEKEFYDLEVRIPRRLQYDLHDFLRARGYTSDFDVTACLFYPDNGFLSWHTNFTKGDYRLYIVRSLKGDSFFRYEWNGEVITDYDPVGYSYRIFKIGDASNPYWHCVYGGSGRYSIGLKVSPTPLETLGETSTNRGD